MIRYLILRLRAKASSFPQLINGNGLRLRKSNSSIPLHCQLVATLKKKEDTDYHLAVLINSFPETADLRIL